MGAVAGLSPPGAAAQSLHLPPSAQKVLWGGWGENCPCIVCLLRVPTGQGCVRVCSPGGVPPLPSGTAASFWLPLGNIQNCFCWQRWAERISEVSCASLGGLEGDTAGPAHIPFCSAEEAWAGRAAATHGVLHEGQHPWGAGAWLKLHFCSVGKMWCLSAAQGWALLGTLVLLCPFNQGCKEWPGLLPPLTPPLSCSPKSRLAPGNRASMGTGDAGCEGQRGDQHPQATAPQEPPQLCFLDKGAPLPCSRL